MEKIENKQFEDCLDLKLKKYLILRSIKVDLPVYDIIEILVICCENSPNKPPNVIWKIRDVKQQVLRPIQHLLYKWSMHNKYIKYVTHGLYFLKFDGKKQLCELTKLIPDKMRRYYDQTIDALMNEKILIRMHNIRQISHYINPDGSQTEYLIDLINSPSIHRIMTNLAGVQYLWVGVWNLNDIQVNNINKTHPCLKVEKLGSLI